MEREFYKISCHAEEMALKNFKNQCRRLGKRCRLGKIKVAVIRLDSFGELADSKPCHGCHQMMLNFGIKKVTYSTSQGNMVTEKLDMMVTTPSVGARTIEKIIATLEMILENCPKG